ncbi:MAG: hypothetical protein AAF394_19290 [Planctomycetota bacterium]
MSDQPYELPPSPTPSGDEDHPDSRMQKGLPAKSMGKPISPKHDMMDVTKRSAWNMEGPYEVPHIE